MHQITIELFVRLWLITDIHVVTGPRGLCNVRNENMRKIPHDWMKHERQFGIK